MSTLPANTINLLLAQIVEPKTAIKKIEESPWIDKIEIKMGRRFPDVFHDIYDSWKFPTFFLGEIQFLANENSSDYEDICYALHRDKLISAVTLQNGYIHFAQSSDGSYDPICFNTSKSIKGDCEVVRLDHEAILINEKIIIRKIIATSLGQYIGEQLQLTQHATRRIKN